MAVIHSASLATVAEYFTVSSADIDRYDAGGFPTVADRIYFDVAPENTTALVCTVSDVEELDATGAHRSEISAPALSRATPYWITWDSFLPSNFPYGAVADFEGHVTYCVMQLHDSPDVGNPIINLSNLALFTNSKGHIVAAVPTAASFADKTAASFYDYYVGPELRLGVWVRCAVLVNFALTAAGFMEVYYDGRPVCKVWNRATDYNNTDAPYIRLGVYDFNHLAGFGRMTQYIRNVVVRDGADGFYAATAAERIVDTALQLL